MNWQFLYGIFSSILQLVNSQTTGNDSLDLDEYEIGGEFIGEDSINITDVDKKWIQVAVVNSAYFLRNHKFNDFDRRYNFYFSLYSKNSSVCKVSIAKTVYFRFGGVHSKF